jgi:hypothetical protein
LREPAKITLTEVNNESLLAILPDLVELEKLKYIIVLSLS